MTGAARRRAGRSAGRSMAAASIDSQVIPSVTPSKLSPARVAREFSSLLASGARIQVVGEARRQRRPLPELGYMPKSKLELFGVTYYLCGLRENEEMRFFVTYVLLGANGGKRGVPVLHPRIFYKDLSLTWRSASHFARSETENWLGKGDVRSYRVNGDDLECSEESTTDLPLEIQTALETLARLPKRIPYDDDAIWLVLRRGPDHRIAPFADFSGPRRKAFANPSNRVNGGKKIARFTRKNDPTSLRFVSGYEPDFKQGVIEVAHGHSRLYGGKLQRFRIVSKNRKVQFLFMAGPRQVWIPSCQATTTQIMSYGVRTIDARVDDDLLIPGYEYHYMDETVDPPELYSQIPKGFVGETSRVDNYRADASPWLDRMPVVRQFRKNVLGKS
jgi:hypothetical protein